MTQKLGKAKRKRLERQAKAGQPITMTDVNGVSIEVRHSGMTYSEFERYMLAHVTEDATCDWTKPASVPCQGCTICCHQSPIEVLPWQEQPEHLAHLLTEPYSEGANGSLQLKHREDGACIHLGEAGCTVYEYRPAACRVYDCRYLSFHGINMRHGGHVEPKWRFDIETHADDVIALALIEGRPEMWQLFEAGANVTRMAQYAVWRHPALKQRAERMLADYEALATSLKAIVEEQRLMHAVQRSHEATDRRPGQPGTMILARLD